MRNLAEERGRADEEEKMSGGVDLRGKWVTAVVALCWMVRVRVGVAVQAPWEMFVGALKLVGGALRVVQKVGMWLMYL